MTAESDKRDDKKILAPVGALFVGMVAAKNLAKQGDDRPLKAMERAERLRKAGAHETKIYAETNKMLANSPYAGVSYGADKKPRFEISDHDSKLRATGLPSSGRGHMGDLVAHETYFKAHPDARLLEVEKVDGRGGSYDGRKITIGENQFAPKRLMGRPVAKPAAKGVALHELQHHAQSIEGHTPGGSPNDFRNRVSDPNMRTALYNSLAGEVEAENTRKRQMMTPAERRATHPDKTASLPRAEQIVTDQHGRVQEIFDPKSIKVTKIHTGAAIKFDYDRDTVADFKKQFPKAKWSQDTKTWHVPGKLAGSRADRWLAAQMDTAGKLAKADAIARDAVAFDGAPKSKYVRPLPQGYRVQTGYDADIVKALKAIPGSSWEAQSKTWMIPHRSANELKAALPAIEHLADKIVAEEKAKQGKRAADKETQRKQWAAERAASTAARDTEMAKVRASRIAIQGSDNVKIGDAVMLGGKVAVVESFGKVFRTDESFSSLHGSRWLGQEGELARYAYTREATPTEVATFRAKEAAAKAESEVRARLHKAASDAKASIESKFAENATPKRKFAAIPQGETLAHFGRQNAIYGGGTEYRLSADGKTIWRIMGNGADGDNWSANNAPGSILSKIKATKDAVSKLRALNVIESSGLRGTQNPDNLRAILEGKAARGKQTVRIQEMVEPPDIRSSGKRHAMAMSEAKAKAPQQSTLTKPTPGANLVQRGVERPNQSKRYVTLGDGRKVTLGQYTEAWKMAKSLPPSTKVRGSPDSPFRDAPNTAGDAVQQFRRALNDRINQKTPGFEQGRKWDQTWQNDARRLAETLKMKSEVPAGQAHPVDLRAKIADRLEPGTKIPPAKGTRVPRKLMGLLAPVAIGAAALVAMNESAKAGETGISQAKAGAIEAGKGVAVMGGFVAGTTLATKGLLKAGMRLATAVPVVQAAMIAGGAVYGAATAKPGERLKGAAKGAFDMSLPGMVVNTGIAAHEAYKSTSERIGAAPSRLNVVQQSEFAAANAAYKSKQSGPIVVKQFERTHRLPSGQMVTEIIPTHTRKRA